MMQLNTLIPQRSTTYQTKLSDFLSRIATNTKRRAIVVFSDFLGLNTQQVKQFQQLKKEHVLVLFQLPVHKEMGQNYDSGMMNIDRLPAIELTKIA
ncbi:MAG: hypothetical protein WCG98_08455 [bacterium]